MDSVSRNRALMPKGTNSIVDGRTLRTSNRRLAELLTPGMKVLDVGCGTGAITYDIAEVVGNTGYVVGVDSNSQMIEEARRRQRNPPWLSFKKVDIYDLPYENHFDVTVVSRVFQWLSKPQIALKQVIRATKIGGKILVLDYNHEKLKWKPAPPESMCLFYRKFLKWRSDAGMDNEVADKLEEWFKACSLENVRVTDQSERLTRRNHDFEKGVSIWADVAASRGFQMVNDNYITEDECRRAVEEYREWVSDKAEEHKLYLLAVEGEKVK